MNERIENGALNVQPAWVGKLSFKKSRCHTLLFHLRPELAVGGDGGGLVAEEDEQEQQGKRSD
jgi:hypothetical protein